jgi:hypothetical protein
MAENHYKYQIPNFDSKTKKFDNIVLLMGFGLAIILAVVLFLIGLNQEEKARYKIELRDIAAVFTAVIVSTTAIYHSLNLKMNMTAHNLKLKLDEDKWNYDKIKAKKDAARAIGREWDNKLDTIAVAKCAIKEYKKNFKRLEKTTDPAEIKKRTALLWILNFFEDVAIGIQADIYDEAILKENFSYLLNRYYQKAKEFIELNRTNDRALFKNFEELRNKWAIH